MFDDSQRLQANPQLLALLSHYARMGAEDRAIWRHRLMEMDGVEARQLSMLHGELIAFNWIEQNTGQTLAECYRITLNGLREYGRFQGTGTADEPSEPPEKSPPRFPRKRKAETLDERGECPGEETLAPAA